jgi:hypothetical protein
LLINLIVMNIFISEQRLTARFVAAVAIVALLLSAFPASFFVAQAEGDAMYTITGHKYECIEGDDGVECNTPVEGWAVFAQNASTMDRVYATTTAGGVYSITVPLGIWEVYEVMPDSWEQYQVIQNGSPAGAIYCRFNFGDVEEGPGTAFMSTSIALAASDESDGTCDFGNTRLVAIPQTIKLCKFEVIGGEINVPKPGWTMYLSTIDPTEVVVEGTTDPEHTLVTQDDGCVSKVVDERDGPWYAYEEVPEGWRQSDVDAYRGFEQNPDGPSYPGYCGFFYKEKVSDRAKISALAELTTEASDEPMEGYLCNFYNVDEREEITGFKWNDENNNGVKDEGEEGVAGWTITATDMSDTGAMAPVTTVTAGDGSYTLLLPPTGDWKITEENRSGWTQTAVYLNGRSSYVVIEDGAPIPFTSCEFNFTPRLEDKSEALLTAEVIDGGPTCDFLNYETPRRSGGGSSSGTRVGSRTPSVPTGAVLGAATSTPQCGIYLNEYMRTGNAASTTEVTRLQVFLNAVGINAPLTGIFDAGTDAAVRTFQAQHKAEVLTPWFLAKIVPHENPTGWVYQLTRWKINNIVCPGSEAYPVLN